METLIYPLKLYLPDLLARTIRMTWVALPLGRPQNERQQGFSLHQTRTDEAFGTINEIGRLSESAP